jgi:urate oxidase
MVHESIFLIILDNLLVYNVDAGLITLLCYITCILCFFFEFYNIFLKTYYHISPMILSKTTSRWKTKKKAQRKQTRIIKFLFAQQAARQGKADAHDCRHNTVAES